MINKKIVIAGGSGFLGQILGSWFQRQANEVVVLSRSADRCQERFNQGVRVVQWDGETLGKWKEELEGTDALINLAGRSVDCRYHEKNRRLIMDSRILSTRILGQAVQQCENPPQVWINSSTATIYKHCREGEEARDENGEIGWDPAAKDEFSIQVAEAWEKEFNQISMPRTRKILIRTAMVFGDIPGTVFRVLRRLVQLGLGGAMGKGNQYVSWIHADDFCAAVEWLITHEKASGIYNVCAPFPLRNREMMEILRKQFKIPIGLPATQWMLEIGAFFLRTETELIIKSRRVIPSRLQKEGFAFRYLHLEDAIEDLKNKTPSKLGIRDSAVRYSS